MSMHNGRLELKNRHGKGQRWHCSQGPKNRGNRAGSADQLPTAVT